MDAVLDRPREPEETQRDEHGTDIGEREAVFRLRFAVVEFPREGIVDGIDFRDDEPDCDKEAHPRAKVHEADLGGVEAVEIAVDGLEVSVEAVGCAEEDRLVDGHC